MKTLFAVFLFSLFFPAAASGMQPMTEAELAAVDARAGAPSESLANAPAAQSPDGMSPRDALRMNDAGFRRTQAAGATPSASGATRTGGGVAIMINDVVIYTNNAGREIWYQTGSAAIGMVWQDESSRMTRINAITDADRF